MSPSDKCDSAGLKGLAELRRLTGQSDQTLINWSKHKPELFEICVIGAAEKKRRNNVSTVNLQQTLQGKKLEWETADDMSGWVAWLPDGVETETVTDAAGDEHEFIETRGREFHVKSSPDGRKWIMTGINGDAV